MLQTSLLTDRKSLGYNNICVAEIPDNAASGCGSAWLEHLVWDQGVAGSNPVTPILFFVGNLDFIRVSLFLCSVKVENI